MTTIAKKPIRSGPHSRTIADTIANCEPFYGSAMEGRWYRNGNPMPFGGQLPPHWLSRLRSDVDTFGVDYIVFSYATPIAWHCVEGFWRVPDVKYSVTTSKHQSRLYKIKS